MLKAGKMLVSTCLPHIRFKFDSQNQGMMVWMESDEFMRLAGLLTSPTCQILDQGKLSPKEGRQCLRYDTLTVLWHLHTCVPACSQENRAKQNKTENGRKLCIGCGCVGLMACTPKYVLPAARSSSVFLDDCFSESLLKQPQM